MKKQEIKLLLVDDDDDFLNLLHVKLKDFGFIQFLLCNSYKEALGKFSDYKPDLALLDIHLENDKTGIELANEFVKIRKTPVIFLTSFYEEGIYEEAKTAFPKAFLSKDFSDLELLQVVELALLDSLREHSSLISNQEKLDFEFLFVKVGSSFIRIILDDVVYFTTSGNYAEVIMSNKRTYITNYSLSALRKLLPPDKFLRIHQSYVINKFKISKINIEQSMIMVAHAELPISRRIKKELFDQMNFL